jgi:hypothetical protein
VVLGEDHLTKLRQLVLISHYLLVRERRSEATRDYVYFQQDETPAHRAKSKYLQDAGVFPYLFP